MNADSGLRHIAQVVVSLQPTNERGNIASGDIVERWRELTGAIPDAVELIYSSEVINTGEAINVQMSSRDTAETSWTGNE